MTETWLSAAQVLQLTGWRRRWLFEQVCAGEVRTRHLPRRSANGRRAREYAASSLPAEAQRKLLSLRLAAEPDQGSLFAPAAAPAVAEDQRLLLEPAERELADRRLQAITPLLDFRRRTNGHRPVIKLRDGRKISSLAALAQYLAGQQRPPVSVRTLWRWYAVFHTSRRDRRPGAFAIISTLLWVALSSRG